MGIRGLASFAKKHRIGRRRTLTDCLVVVDGNCLLYFLKHGICDTWPETLLNGGGYRAFAAHAQAFLDKLGSARVTPVIIFQGITDSSKRQTLNQRKSQKLANSVDVAEQVREGTDISFIRGASHVNNSAVLLYSCLADVLRSSQVEFFVADGENDEVVATVARHRKAEAVLANDSDYLISSRYVQYVPLTELELNLASENGVPVGRAYTAQDLADKLNLPVSLLPAFACLASNDSFQTSALEAFYRTVFRGVQPRFQDVAKFLRRRTWKQTLFKHISKSKFEIAVRKYACDVTTHDAENIFSNLDAEVKADAEVLALFRRRQLTKTTAKAVLLHKLSLNPHGYTDLDGMLDRPLLPLARRLVAFLSYTSADSQVESKPIHLTVKTAVVTGRTMTFAEETELLEPLTLSPAEAPTLSSLPKAMQVSGKQLLLNCSMCCHSGKDVKCACFHTICGTNTVSLSDVPVEHMVVLAALQLTHRQYMSRNNVKALLAQYILANDAKTAYTPQKARVIDYDAAVVMTYFQVVLGWLLEVNAACAMPYPQPQVANTYDGNTFFDLQRRIAKQPHTLQTVLGAEGMATLDSWMKSISA